MSRATRRKIESTKNYRLFVRSDENRPINLKKHKKLVDSMKLYGWLPSFPMVCVRDKSGCLFIKDGQHRHAIAQMLGIAVYWTEEFVDFDIALINGTPQIWTLRDYAEKYASNNNAAYVQGLQFAERHSLPLGIAFTLLAGVTGWTNIRPMFVNGTFQVRDEVWAEMVGSLYSAMLQISSELRTTRFIEACMACARVDGFDESRMVHNAKQCREKLVSYSTRDAFLEMMEYVYNFKRRQTIPLKFMALDAMRKRNPAKSRSNNGRASKG